MTKSSKNVVDDELRTIKLSSKDYSQIYGRTERWLAGHLDRGEVPEVIAASESEILVGGRIEGRQRTMLPTIEKEGAQKTKIGAGSWVLTDFVSSGSVSIRRLNIDAAYPYAILEGKGAYRMRFSLVGTP